MQVEAALMYDAVNVVVNAVKQLQRTGAPRLRVANLSCDELQAWSHGSSLYNYINMASQHYNIIPSAHLIPVSSRFYSSCYSLADRTAHPV